MSAGNVKISVKSFSAFFQIVRRAAMFAVPTVLAVAGPASAQDLQTKVQNLGTLVINVLTVAAVSMGIVATIGAGVKFMSADMHAKEQVKGLAIGALLCFAAAPIVQAMKTAVG